ncbi:MAG TPA: 50S ribosomal protein L18Ae [Candidatus Thermoplasmatota archaeon]
MGKVYRVSGTFYMGARTAHFVTDFEVATAERAREKALSDFGSRHHVNRRQITIEKVEEVKGEAATRKGTGG